MKCDGLEVCIDYYGDRYDDNGNLFTRFNKIYKFAFKTYKMISKYPIFMDIVHEADAFFNKDIFIRAIENGLTNNIVDWIEHDILIEVVNDVHKCIQSVVDLEDVPDEFLDPIMSTPINEPVILPGTNVIMDMSVISTHLLSSKTNPFTRGELTIEILEEYNKREDIRKRVADFQDRFTRWKNGSERYIPAQAK